MEKVTNKYDMFYCYFDIDFSSLVGMLSEKSENIILSIEVRPGIKKKSIDEYPKGFINASDTPMEN